MIREGDDAPLAVRADRQDRQVAGLDEDLAVGRILEELVRHLRLGEEFSRDAGRYEMGLGVFPHLFDERGVLRVFGVAAFANRIGRAVHQRRDVPDADVAFGLVALERTPFDVADRRVD